MRHLFRIFVVLPIAIILLLFAIANRHVVTVSFDPFPGGDIQGISVTAPLFVVLTGIAMIGLLVGGFVVWLRQGRWRREARSARADARAAQAELERLRAEAPQAIAPAGSALVPVRRTAA